MAYTGARVSKMANARVCVATSPESASCCLLSHNACKRNAGYLAIVSYSHTEVLANGEKPGHV